jgi:hypothetical protein
VNTNEVIDLFQDLDRSDPSLRPRKRTTIKLAPEDFTPEDFEAMEREARRALGRATAERKDRMGPRAEKTVTPAQRQAQKAAWLRKARAEKRACVQGRRKGPRPLVVCWCGRKNHARGLCTKHYEAYRRGLRCAK